jgi:hypothetical protein
MCTSHQFQHFHSLVHACSTRDFLCMYHALCELVLRKEEYSTWSGAGVKPSTLCTMAATSAAMAASAAPLPGAAAEGGAASDVAELCRRRVPLEACA